MKEEIRNKYRRMQNTTCFQIAGHTVALTLPSEVVISDWLPSFADFVIAYPQGSTIVQMTFVYGKAPNMADCQLLSDVSPVWVDRFWLKESSDAYICTVNSEDGCCSWQMFSSKDFRHAKIFATGRHPEESAILSWMLMVVYGQAVLSFNTVLLHASVVEKGGQGFAFLGKSGTGKSTHSRLWLTHVPHTTLLNDDNPALKMENDGTVMIYGTPWSGKTPCYKNRGIPLKGLVRLQQGLGNTWTNVRGTEALLTVLPSCTAIRWNRWLYNRMVDQLEKVVASVCVGQLTCLPDHEAAQLCYQKLTHHENK